MQKIGVFVCWCGSNIAATVDVKAVANAMKSEPGVVFSTDYQYMCSENGQNLIKNAVVISEEDIDHSKINVGSTVTLIDLEDNEEIEFAIVGTAEVNSLAHRISTESPLGKALSGRQEGDEIEVDFMGNISRYKVKNVTRTK